MIEEFKFFIPLAGDGEGDDGGDDGGGSDYGDNENDSSSFGEIGDFFSDAISSVSDAIGDALGSLGGGFTDTSQDNDPTATGSYSAADAFAGTSFAGKDFSDNTGAYAVGDDIPGGVQNVTSSYGGSWGDYVANTGGVLSGTIGYLGDKAVTTDMSPTGSFLGMDAEYEYPGDEGYGGQTAAEQAAMDGGEEKTKRISYDEQPKQKDYSNTTVSNKVETESKQEEPKTAGQIGYEKLKNEGSSRISYDESTGGRSTSSVGATQDTSGSVTQEVIDLGLVDNLVFSLNPRKRRLSNQEFRGLVY